MLNEQEFYSNNFTTLIDPNTYNVVLQTGL